MDKKIRGTSSYALEARNTGGFPLESRNRFRSSPRDYGPVSYDSSMNFQFRRIA